MSFNPSRLFALGLLVGLCRAAPPVTGRQVATRFVTTDGSKFKLDGKDFYFAGSNAYYFPFSGVRICPTTDPSTKLTYS